MGRQSRPTLCNRLESDSEPAGKDNTQFRPRRGRMTKTDTENLFYINPDENLSDRRGRIYRF